MKRVLIIGAGGVATVAAHKVAKNTDVFGEIMIASRTKSKCDAIVKAIGRPDITLAFFDARNEQLDETQERFGPQEAAGLLRLREPRYAALCRNGLFSRIR